MYYLFILLGFILLLLLLLGVYVGLQEYATTLKNRRDERLNRWRGEGMRRD